jgi:hypothetical protein
MKAARSQTAAAERMRNVAAESLNETENNA